MSDKPEGEPPKEKKIVVDEDWKSQVQAEKEALEQKPQPKDAPSKAARPQPTGPLPPPTLAVLVNSLGIQAMVVMGMIPNPVSGKPEVDLDEAKHLIDTIAMLEEKTEGNRTPEETRAIGDLLHELRMSYLAVQQKRPEASGNS
jgi:hypothetical protein